MPGTYSHLLFHIVFATKHRSPWITDALAARLHPYLGGIVRGEGGSALAIGGMADHVHLLIRWRTDMALSELMRNVKGRSSRWVHETFPGVREFAWQEGYGAFTVSASQEPVVRRYIETQAEHHRTDDFRAEFTALLVRHGVEFDERYVFE